jgi:hypothetical protein
MGLTGEVIHIEPLSFSPREEPRYVVGVDLGQSSDPTAIAIICHLKGFREERFDVVHLERLPLGTPYPGVVQYVSDLLSRSPLCSDGGDYDSSDDWRRRILKLSVPKRADLIIDETGVGRAVGDIFEQAGLKPKRVSITAGMEVTQPLRDHWHVSKTILISTVDALLHTGELRFAAELTEAPAMKDELLDFRRHLGAIGRASYAARTGKHDDLVLAVAIAAWWLKKPPVMQRGWLGGY